MLGHARQVAGLVAMLLEGTMSKGEWKKPVCRCGRCRRCQWRAASEKYRAKQSERKA